MAFRVTDLKDPVSHAVPKVNTDPSGTENEAAEMESLDLALVAPCISGNREVTPAIPSCMTTATLCQGGARR